MPLMDYTFPPPAGWRIIIACYHFFSVWISAVLYAARCHTMASAVLRDADAATACTPAVRFQSFLVRTVNAAFLLRAAPLPDVFLADACRFAGCGTDNILHHVFAMNKLLRCSRTTWCASQLVPLCR
ncbi:hypothetical protein AVEN_197476-1 [Araneus ventricosus]|uniref:Uncharacterized protein n=1 Tax=Araneus ventricosus TaxID=182803 RepID=A0A4Y2NLJ4_ARAVE|nr:hypothetical protein AVEN_197476-1 [Araneus ventricosus]